MNRLHTSIARRILTENPYENVLMGAYFVTSWTQERMNEIESRNSMNEKSRSFVKKNVCFCFDTDLNVRVPQKRGVSSVFPNKSRGRLTFIFGTSFLYKLPKHLLLVPELNCG